MIDKSKINEEIRQLAYEIYLKSGCIPNRDLDNWLEAERIVMLKYGFTKESENYETEEVKKERKKTSEKKAGSTKTKVKTKGKKK